ncbi:MAG: hypothetical protein DRP64_11510 [Verrucomicrobia bacterium]|nr:MAG: hypothetical protein DRP64_11510 [Verrucomicrobiota bacterium]
MKNGFRMLASLGLVLAGQVFGAEGMELLGTSSVPVLLISETAPACLQIAAKDFHEATGLTLEIANKVPTGKMIILAGQCAFLKSLDATHKLGFEKPHR